MLILYFIPAVNNFSTKARQKANQILNGKSFKNQHLGFIRAFLNFINRIYNDTLGKIFKVIGHLFHSLFSAGNRIFGPNGPIIVILIIAAAIGILIYFVVLRRQRIAAQHQQLVAEKDFEKIDDIGTLSKLLEKAKIAGDFNLCARIKFRICLIRLEEAQILIRYENRTLGQISGQLNDFDFSDLASVIERIVYFTYNLDEAAFLEFSQNLESAMRRLLKTAGRPDPLSDVNQIESLIG